MCIWEMKFQTFCPNTIGVSKDVQSHQLCLVYARNKKFVTQEGIDEVE